MIKTGIVEYSDRKNRSKKTRAIFFISASVAIIAALLFNFSNLHQEACNYLDFYTGKVEILKPDNSKIPAAIKKRLFLTDKIQTYALSKAYIQFGEEHLVEVKENTLLVMSALPLKEKCADEETRLSLISGKIFVKAGKLTSRGKLTIVYKTNTISVRGTIFSVEGDGVSLTVRVLEGSVFVNPGDGGEDFLINPGEKLVITGNKKVKRKMETADESGFSDIGKLEPVPDIRSATEEYIKNWFMSILNGKDNNGSPQQRNKTDYIFREKKESPGEAVKDGVRLNVNTFAASGVDTKESAQLTKRIYSKLLSGMGSEKIISRETDGPGKNANRQLTGRVSKVGEGMVISVSVVNGETGAVIFSKTVQVRDSESADDAVDSIADKIISAGEIW